MPQTGPSNDDVLRNQVAQALDLNMPMHDSQEEIESEPAEDQEMQVLKQRLRQLMPQVQFLQLEVISSASLPKGQIITINTMGLFGTFLSEREKD